MLIHHVVDSSQTDSGSVAPVVRGLISQLEGRGFSCSLTHAFEDSHENSIALTREADVVHVHGCSYVAMIGATWFAKRLGKPFIVSAVGELSAAAIGRHPWRDRWRGKLYERKLIRGASAILAQNESEASALRDRYGREVLVLPYGLSLDEDGRASSGSEVDLPVRREGRCVLMLAPIEPKTGCAALLKAYAEVGSDGDGWHIVVAGSDRGDFRKMLEAAIRRKGGGDRVFLVPTSDEGTERELLGRADVLVAPSLEPGSATSMLKAAALGVPILASREVLPDALISSVVVCESNRSGIREGLRRILKLTNAERDEMTRRAETVVRNELDWRILADRYVPLYNSLA